MMIDYMSKFNPPKECIERSRIPKKLFYEEYNMIPTDKKLFTNDIDKIILEYMFSDERINISSYKDNEVECEEVAIIKVLLNSDKKYKKICEIIQKAIPYSLIIICEYKDSIVFNVADKRINKNDKEKNSIQEIIFTEWINLNEINKREEEFFNILNVKQWSHNNLYKFYNSFIDKIKIFKATKYSSNIEYKNTINIDEIKQITDEIEKVNLDISISKNKMRKEDQFNKKIDLNIKIKKLEIYKKELVKKLSSYN